MARSRNYEELLYEQDALFDLRKGVYAAAADGERREKAAEWASAASALPTQTARFFAATFALDSSRHRLGLPPPELQQQAVAVAFENLDLDNVAKPVDRAMAALVLAGTLKNNDNASGQAISKTTEQAFATALKYTGEISDVVIRTRAIKLIAEHAPAESAAGIEAQSQLENGPKLSPVQRLRVEAPHVIGPLLARFNPFI